VGLGRLGINSGAVREQLERWSMTRTELSLFIQIALLVSVIGFSVIIRRMKLCIVTGIIIMSLANILGNIVFGEGHTAFPGFFLYPVYGAVAAWVTIKASRYSSRKTGREKQDE